MPLPFEQLPKESAKAFAAFSVYLSLGPERSIRAVGEKLGKSEGLLERWSRKFDWPARVQAYAANLAVLEREATEALARTSAAQWLTRREEGFADLVGLAWTLKHHPQRYDEVHAWHVRLRAEPSRTCRECQRVPHGPVQIAARAHAGRARGL